MLKDLSAVFYKKKKGFKKGLAKVMNIFLKKRKKKKIKNLHANHVEIILKKKKREYGRD